MLEQKQFQLKAQLLGSKLSGLWLFVYEALTLGATPERIERIRRVLSEVNRLHGEMFPELEHGLYSDDFLSMIEDVLPRVRVVRPEDLDPEILSDLGTQLMTNERYFEIGEPPGGIDVETRKALDEDWRQANS